MADLLRQKYGYVIVKEDETRFTRKLFLIESDKIYPTEEQARKIYPDFKKKQRSSVSSLFDTVTKIAICKIKLPHEWSYDTKPAHNEYFLCPSIYEILEVIIEEKDG